MSDMFTMVNDSSKRNQDSSCSLSSLEEDNLVTYGVIYECNDYAVSVGGFEWSAPVVQCDAPEAASALALVILFCLESPGLSGAYVENISIIFPLFPELYFSANPETNVDN
ncbi:hypothetical protein RB195_017726 [Necator americanus]|uniref:Sushi domain-containing protein n=1 Tax=Necator americanus TaxID=51031 RepID=A0ABR1C8Z4_NECAM